MIPRSLLVIGATVFLASAVVALPLALVFLGVLRWGDDVLFFVFAEVMVVSGLLVVTMRDIIRCGLAMIVCFGALAGIYVLAGAPLIGAAQVLVYIGAISVLILFAIMLTQTKDAPASLVLQTQAVGAAVAAVVLFLVITVTVVAADWPAVGQRVVTVTQDLAAHLFDEYVLPFEIVSVLLLAAVIGGVFLAKREEGGPP
jgi:NADH:ubiquinone oxidoreductase subunit 6 (subunit J)